MFYTLLVSVDARQGKLSYPVGPDAAGEWPQNKKGHAEIGAGVQVSVGLRLL